MGAKPRLIVGLGNPGAQYRGTRHNVGFEVVNRLAVKLRAPLRRRAFRGRVGVAHQQGAAVTLLLPTTFMNLSGVSVAQAVKALDLLPEDVLIVCDDLDLDLGRLRMRLKGSSGGHNGLRSVIEQLQTEQVARLRIGIGRPGERSVVDYVLGTFSPLERPLINDAVERAVQACVTALTDDMELAMSRHNGPAAIE